MTESILYVNSIFKSISGEYGACIPQGAPTTFLRLQGCDLRCPYCDAKSTWRAKGGKEKMAMAIADVIDAIVLHESDSINLLITGGEPLLQKEGLAVFLSTIQNMVESAGGSLNVQLETSGFHKVPTSWTLADDPVIKGVVFDYKLKSSRAKTSPVLYFNAVHRTALDVPIVTKFVIQDYTDLHEAILVTKALCDTAKVFPDGDFHTFVFSICKESTAPALLIKYILNNRELPNNIVINTQIHKVFGIDGKEEKGLFDGS